jgi:hypothetical protein
VIQIPSDPIDPNPFYPDFLHTSTPLLPLPLSLPVC